MKYKGVNVRPMPRIIKMIFRNRGWYFRGKIYINPELKGQDREDVLRHEYGHHKFRDTRTGLFSDMVRYILPISLLYPPAFLLTFATFFFLSEYEEIYIFKFVEGNPGAIQKESYRIFAILWQ